MSSSLLYYQKSTSKRCVVALMPGINKKRNIMSIRFAHPSRPSNPIVQAPIHFTCMETILSYIPYEIDLVELTPFEYREVEG